MTGSEGLEKKQLKLYQNPVLYFLALHLSVTKLVAEVNRKWSWKEV